MVAWDALTNRFADGHVGRFVNEFADSHVGHVMDWFDDGYVQIFVLPLGSRDDHLWLVM